MNDIIEIQQVFKTILKRWWLLALLLPLGVAGGYSLSRTQTPVYQATATVLVGPLFQASDLNRQDLLTSQLIATTYTDLVPREPVLSKVVESLGLKESWRQLKKQITVEQVRDTQLVQITVENRSPEAARRIADEIVRQLIALPSDLNSEQNNEELVFAQNQMETLKGRIDTGNSRLTALENGIITASSPEELAALQSERDTLQSLVTSWENNYTQLLVFLGNQKAPNTVSLIEPAQPTPSPVRPSVRLYLAVGGVFGLFLALLSIFLLEYLDDTLNEAEEFARESGLPVIGKISALSWFQKKERGVVVANQPRSPVAEAYRSLRANLEFAGAQAPLKTVLVTSCEMGVGKSSVAANLAAILAQNDKKVVLVDADLRKPRLHEMLGLPNQVGLSDVLQNRVDVAGALQAWSDRRVRVITSGEAPGNPAELLSSRRMSSVLERLGEGADVVIIDSPPSVVSDALVLAAKVDGVLLVVRPGRTRRRYLQPFLEHLERAEARAIGVVMNRVPHSRSDLYGRYPYGGRGASLGVKLPLHKGEQVQKLGDADEEAFGLRY